MILLGAWFTLRTGTDGCRLVLLEGCGSLWWDAVVGRRAVSLDFLAAEVAVGVVIVVALLFL